MGSSKRAANLLRGLGDFNQTGNRRFDGPVTMDAGMRLGTNSAVTVSNVGSYATPSVALTAADSGKTYFLNCGTVSICMQLPPPQRGLYFKFILATASDNEGTKDCAITTGSDSVDMGGHVSEAGGTPTEVTNATSVIAWDTSEGAATVGDWLDFHCDGTDWYVRGSAVTASAFAIHNDADGHTIP